MAKQLSNNEISQAFVKDAEYIDNLVFHQEYQTFFIYRDGHYQKFDHKAFVKEVFNYIMTRFPEQNIKQDMIRDIIFQIEMLCFRQEQKEQDHLIAFKDVLYNTVSFETQKMDKSEFTIFSVPYFWEEIKMEIPNFKRFLNTSIVKLTDDKEGYLPDKKLIDLVQEMFGYLLLGGLKGYKAWFLIGEGANGKGVLTRVLSNIFGKDYVQSMTIQALTTDKYNLVELIGKKINISSEDESKYITADKFKAIVSGDPVHTQVKFKQGFSFVPKTKFIFSSNRMPIFRDLDYGIERRLVFIPFKRIFKEGDIDRDNKIDEKLKKETPGIIRWALEGAERLTKNNFVYSLSSSSEEMIKEFKEDILSGYQFIKENYIIDDTAITGKKNLYTSYRIYCDNIGRKPYSYNNFKKQIVSNIEGLKEKKTSIDYKYVDGYNVIEKTEYERRMEEIKESFIQDKSAEKIVWNKAMQGNIFKQDKGKETGDSSDKKGD